MPAINAKPFLDRFDDVVSSTPDKVAVVDLSVNRPFTMTFRELDHLADRVATGLLQLGVDAGEAVAYQLPSGWEFILLTLGIWKVGAIACPLLPSLREREVRFILESSGAHVLVIPDSFRGYEYKPLAEAAISAVPQDVRLFVLPQADDARQKHASNLGSLAARAVDTAAVQARRPSPDALAQLLYTSGTTGEPKGVLHTFETLSYGLATHAQALGLTAEDTVWVPSPLAHQTGFLYGMMVSHYNGSTGVYQSVWNVGTAKMAIEQYGARFVQAAMPFLADLTRCDTPPKGLRIFVATGAAIPRQLASEAREALDCAVVGGWGSTESCLVTVGRPEDPAHRLWGTDGCVIDSMEIRIVDDKGQVVPYGQEGNFQVKTPAMFVTYLHHPEWYKKAMTDDGFFDTGDMAVIEDDGYLKLTGRKKDVINRGGEKVPVAQIEDILYRHSDIQDVAIVAMPDERLGERACAFVVPKAASRTLALSDLTTYLEGQGVAKIYWPERLEVVPELPRTPSGKVQKYLLRDRIAKVLSVTK